jgi:CheY-like chemotaxis protein
MATVLIVEDEPILLVLTESVIQSNGSKTLSASSLAEAKAIVESAQEFDLLFTDLTLGGEHDGGIEVANLLAHVRPEIPVVYTSGRELTDGLKALFVENSHFLAKPYTDTQMSYCFGRRRGAQKKKARDDGSGPEAVSAVHRPNQWMSDLPPIKDQTSQDSLGPADCELLNGAICLCQQSGPRAGSGRQQSAPR